MVGRVMPAPDKVKPYQNDGISFLAAHPRAILADDAGLGKSLQMIRAANAVGADRILLITPASGTGSWQLQFQEWDLCEDRVFCTLPVGKNKQAIPATGPCVLMVTQEWLGQSKNRDALNAAMDAVQGFDVAFVDEAHGLKNPQAKRTKHIYGARLDLGPKAILRRTPRRWIATATPAPLHVGELYAHLRALFPDVLASLFDGQVPNRFAFEDRFLDVEDTRFGRRIIGNKLSEMLDLRMALEPHMLMRQKGDVLSELEPIQTEMLPLDTGFRSLHDLSAAQVKAMTDDQIVAMLGAEASSPQHATVRRAFGLKLADAATPWVRDFLDADPTRKLILFAHHRTVIDTLMDRFAKYDPVTVHGGTNKKSDKYSVHRFQNDIACRLFVGQTRAAGVAITLTAAQTVLLLEPDPAPQINYQAISRAHRIGQTGGVTAHVAYDAASAVARRHAQALRRRAKDNYHLFGAETPGAI